MTITDYNFDLTTKRITHKIKDKEVLKRWIQRAIMTERNAYPQYTQEYGVELEHLKGKYINYVVINMEQSIRECLQTRTEINNIYDFQYEKIENQKNAIQITFTVDTIYGTWQQNTKASI